MSYAAAAAAAADAAALQMPSLMPLDAAASPFAMLLMPLIACH